MCCRCQTDKQIVSKAFAAVCLLQLVGNMDAGVLPSSLIQIRDEFDLSYGAVGVLGALVYLGLVFGAALSGWALLKFQSKRVTLAALLSNSAAVLLFGAAPNVPLLFVARFLIGFTQAPLFVYAPVWTDEHAPVGSQTKWMSLLQAFVAMGIMVGYVLGGLLTTNAGDKYWRTALYIQAGLLLPFAGLLSVMPARLVGSVGLGPGDDPPVLLLKDGDGTEAASVPAAEDAAVVSPTRARRRSAFVTAPLLMGRSRARTMGTTPTAAAGTPYPGRRASAALSVQGLPFRPRINSVFVPWGVGAWHIKVDSRRHTYPDTGSRGSSVAAAAPSVTSTQPTLSAVAEEGSGSEDGSQGGGIALPLTGDGGAGVALEDVVPSGLLRGRSVDDHSSDGASDIFHDQELDIPSLQLTLSDPEHAMLDGDGEGSPPAAKAKAESDEGDSCGGAGGEAPADGDEAKAEPDDGVLQLGDAVEDGVDVSGLDESASQRLVEVSSTMDTASLVPVVSTDGGDDDDIPAEDLQAVEELSHNLGFHLKLLWSCRVYVYVTLALSMLYFVVTGVQFYVTDYLQSELDADPSAVVAGFAATSLTAPTAGVFFGGWAIDRLGGYSDASGAAMARALKACVTMGAFALLFSVLAGFASTFWTALAALWLVLFFGGAIVPPCTGITLAAVPASLRNLSASVSMMLFNLLGYAMAPFLCGMLADATSLTWGFRAVMWTSLLAGLCLFVAWRHATAAVKMSAAPDSPGKLLPGVDEDRLNGVLRSPAGARLSARVRASIVESFQHVPDPTPDVKYELARTRGYTFTSVAGLFANEEEEEPVPTSDA